MTQFVALKDGDRMMLRGRYGLLWMIVAWAILVGLIGFAIIGTATVFQMLRG